MLFLLCGGDRATRGRDGHRRAPRGARARARRLRAPPDLRAGPHRAHGAGLSRRHGRPARARDTGSGSATWRSSTCARCAAGWPSSRRSGCRAPRWRDVPPRPACSPGGCTGPGQAPRDAGASLGSPKALRTLPSVLRADEASDLIRSAAALADDGSPMGLRDVAMLELLYATGIRVGELVGLDVDDLDRDRNVVRVLGKGRKERMVPFGHPAARALDRWLAEGRHCDQGRGGGWGAVPRRPGPTHRPARGAHPRAPSDRRRAWRAGHRTARATSLSGDPPAGGWRGPALGPGAPRARVHGHDAALHPRHDRPAAAGLPAGTPARLSSVYVSRRAAGRCSWAARSANTSAPPTVTPSCWPATAPGSSSAGPPGRCSRCRARC